MADSFNEVDAPTAIGSAAVAGLTVGMVGDLIVDDQLFARTDIVKCKEEDVAGDDTDRAVWLTGVVDKLGSIAPFAAIDCPVGVDSADMNPPLSAQSPGDLAA